jgi:hypothetical protein
MSSAMGNARKGANKAANMTSDLTMGVTKGVTKAAYKTTGKTIQLTGQAALKGADMAGDAAAGVRSTTAEVVAGTGEHIRKQGAVVQTAADKRKNEADIMYDEDGNVVEAFMNAEDGPKNRMEFAAKQGVESSVKQAGREVVNLPGTIMGKGKDATVSVVSGAGATVKLTGEGIKAAGNRLHKKAKEKTVAKFEDLAAEAEKQADDDEADIVRRRNWIFASICFLEFLLNVDAGVLPAAISHVMTEFHLSYTAGGSLGALVYVGLVFSSPLCGWALTNFQEQRHVMLGSAILNAVAVFGFALSVNSPMLFSFRLLMGFAQAPIFIYAPVWCDEFAPDGAAATWIAILQATVALGIMAGYMFAGITTTQWDDPGICERLSVLSLPDEEWAALSFNTASNPDGCTVLVEGRPPAHTWEASTLLDDAHECECVVPDPNHIDHPLVAGKYYNEHWREPLIVQGIFIALFVPFLWFADGKYFNARGGAEERRKFSVKWHMADNLANHVVDDHPDDIKARMESAKEDLEAKEAALKEAKAQDEAAKQKKMSLHKKTAREEAAAAMEKAQQAVEYAKSKYDKAVAANESCEVTTNKKLADVKGKTITEIVSTSKSVDGMNSGDGKDSVRPSLLPTFPGKSMLKRLQRRDPFTELGIEGGHKGDGAHFNDMLLGESLGMLELFHGMFHEGEGGGNLADAGLSAQLSLMFSSKLFVNLTLALAGLYFVVTGMQFWITDYMTLDRAAGGIGAEPGLVVLCFTLASLTAPTSGVLIGGYIVDKRGGYVDETGEAAAKTMQSCAVFGLLSAGFAIPAAFRCVPTQWCIGVFGCLALSRCLRIAALISGSSTPLSGWCCSSVEPSCVH